MIEGSPKNERSYTSYAKSVSYEGSRTEPTLGEIRIIGERKTIREKRQTHIQTETKIDRQTYSYRAGV